jgi:hypothetical protein
MKPARPPAGHRGCAASKLLAFPASILNAAYAVRKHEQGATVILGWIGLRTIAVYLQRLYTLAGDPRLRTQLGQIGRRRIETGVSSERWIPTRATILRGG